MIGILLASNVLNLLIAQYEAQLLSLFMGLCSAVFRNCTPRCGSTARNSRKAHRRVFSRAWVRAAVCAGRVQCGWQREVAELTIPGALLAGAVLSVGTIIPGISSSSSSSIRAVSCGDRDHRERDGFQTLATRVFPRDRYVRRAFFTAACDDVRVCARVGRHHQARQPHAEAASCDVLRAVIVLSWALSSLCCAEHSAEAHMGLCALFPCGFSAEPAAAAVQSAAGREENLACPAVETP